MTTQTFDGIDNPAPGGPNPPFILRALRGFRHWRKGRPFPAGLLIALAGIELWLAPLSSIGNIIHEGIGGVSAFFIGALMLMFGLAVWFAPPYRVFAGIASILLGLIALPATNLGGFLLGTMLALIGGGLAVAWTPRPGWEAPTWRERGAHRYGTDEAGYAGEAVEEPEHAQAQFAAYDGADDEPAAASADERFPAPHGEDASARPQD
jgi:hypothetical protein